MEEVMQSTVVNGDARDGFLFNKITHSEVEFEARVFNIASQHTEYKGGMWDFMTLPNGGFYMRAPEGKYHWSNPDNYSDGDVSADALGVIACLYAFSIMSFHTSELGEYYHKLREYAYTHPEAEIIFAAID